MSPAAQQALVQQTLQQVTIADTKSTLPGKPKDGGGGGNGAYSTVPPIVAAAGIGEAELTFIEILIAMLEASTTAFVWGVAIDGAFDFGLGSGPVSTDSATIASGTSGD